MYSIKQNPNQVTAVADADEIGIHDASTGLQSAVAANVLKIYGGKKVTVSAAGPTDNVDVTGASVLIADTTSNNVTIGGLAGGVDRQFLHIVKNVAANNLVVEHDEGGGAQDILFHDAADQTITAVVGGYTLYCDGTNWIVIGVSTDAT